MRVRYFVNGIFIFLISIILVFLGIKIYKGFVQNQLSYNEDLPITKVLNSSDSLEFRNFISRIDIVQIRNSKVRNSIFQLILDGMYSLIIYKIPASNDLNLTSLNFKKIGIDRSVGVTYNIIDNSPQFKFQYRAGKTIKAKKIFLTMSIDRLTFLNYGDSCVSYNGYCKNFSIRYNENEPIDLFFESETQNKLLKEWLGSPIELLLYKKDNHIYLYLLIANKSDNIIAQDILKKIVIK